MNWFKKEVKSYEIVSPINGSCIDIEEVEDKVFADKLMGEGVGLLLSDGTIYSPIDGEVVLIPESKHAIGLKTNTDIKLLIHVGLDTVNLQGKGFEVFVKENQKIKKGDVLLKVDMDYMKSVNAVLTTPIVITNSSEYTIEYTNKKEVKAGDVIMIVSPK